MSSENGFKAASIFSALAKEVPHMFPWKASLRAGPNVLKKRRDTNWRVSPEALAGHDVVLVSGFWGWSTHMLAVGDAFQSVGANVHYVKGFQKGPAHGDIKRVEDTLLEAFNKAGGKKVSIVGFSLGGLYAHEMVRAHSDKVQSVVTIATPLGGGINPESASLGASFQITNKKHPVVYDSARYLSDLLPTIGRDVPVTSVFSMGDCFVNPWTCLVPDGGKRANVVAEGNAGHYQMLYDGNVQAICVKAVIDALPDAAARMGADAFPHIRYNDASMKGIAQGRVLRWWDDLPVSVPVLPALA